MIPTYDREGNQTGREISFEEIAYPQPDSYNGGFHKVHLLNSAGGQDVIVSDDDTQPVSD